MVNHNRGLAFVDAVHKFSPKENKYKKFNYDNILNNIIEDNIEIINDENDIIYHFAKTNYVNFPEIGIFGEYLTTAEFKEFKEFFEIFNCENLNFINMDNEENPYFNYNKFIEYNDEITIFNKKECSCKSCNYYYDCYICENIQRDVTNIISNYVLKSKKFNDFLDSASLLQGYNTSTKSEAEYANIRFSNRSYRWSDSEFSLRFAGHPPICHCDFWVNPEKIKINGNNILEVFDNVSENNIKLTIDDIELVDFIIEKIINKVFSKETIIDQWLRGNDSILAYF